MGKLSNVIGNALKTYLIIQVFAGFLGLIMILCICNYFFVACHEEGTSYDKLNKKEIEQAIENEHGIDAVYEYTEIYNDEKYYIYHDADITDLKFCGYSASTDAKFAWGYVTKENYLTSKRNYEIEKLISDKVLSNTSNVPVTADASPYDKANKMITVTAESYDEIESCAEDIVYICKNYDCELDFVYTPAFSDKLFTVKYFLNYNMVGYGDDSQKDFMYNSDSFTSDVLLNDISDLCRMYKDNCDLSQELIDSHNENELKTYEDSYYVDSENRFDITHYELSSFTYGELYYMFENLGFEVDGNPTKYTVLNSDGDLCQFGYDFITPDGNYYYIENNKNFEVGKIPSLREYTITELFGINFENASDDSQTSTTTVTVTTPPDDSNHTIASRPSRVTN